MQCYVPSNPIQAFILGSIERKRYLKKRAAIVKMQSVMKMYIIRSEFLRRMSAATKIQTCWRGFQARKLRAQLAEEKRIEEERRKEEERQRAVSK